MRKTKEEKQRQLKLERATQLMREWRTDFAKLQRRGLSDDQIKASLARRKRYRLGRKVELTGDPLIDARREYYRLMQAEYRQRKATGVTIDRRKLRGKFGIPTLRREGAPSAYMLNKYGQNATKFKAVDELTRLKRLIYQHKKILKEGIHGRSTRTKNL